MQWLLHGSLTPAVAAALVRHEHKVHPMDELQLPPESALAEILAAADKKQWDIISNDPAIARDIFEAPVQGGFSRTIVFLQLPGGDVEQDDAIDRLFARYKRLTPRRLYSVTETRVKIRQLPGT